jgi:hypothetical protein
LEIGIQNQTISRNVPSAAQEEGDLITAKVEISKQEILEVFVRQVWTEERYLTDEGAVLADLIADRVLEIMRGKLKNESH